METSPEQPLYLEKACRRLKPRENSKLKLWAIQIIVSNTVTCCPV